MPPRKKPAAATSDKTNGPQICRRCNQQMTPGGIYCCCHGCGCPLRSHGSVMRCRDCGKDCGRWTADTPPATPKLRTPTNATTGDTERQQEEP